MNVPSNKRKLLAVAIAFGIPRRVSQESDRGINIAEVGNKEIGGVTALLCDKDVRININVRVTTDMPVGSDERVGYIGEVSQGVL